MLRMQDYKCGRRCDDSSLKVRNGLFEILHDLNIHDDEARAAIRSHPCPVCGESAPSVWLRSPGLAGIYRHTVTFAGHTYDEEFVEQQLCATSTPPVDYFDTAEGEAELVEIDKKNQALAAAGNLPPVQSDEHVQAAVSALKE